MVEEIKVSDDLMIITFGKGALQIHSAQYDTNVGITRTELPALLAALEKAAQGMGVETAYAALLAFVKEFKAFTSREDYVFLNDAEYNACINTLAEHASAALAKAEENNG